MNNFTNQKYDTFQIDWPSHDIPNMWYYYDIQFLVFPRDCCIKNTRHQWISFLGLMHDGAWFWLLAKWHPFNNNKIKEQIKLSQLMFLLPVWKKLLTYYIFTYEMIQSMWPVLVKQGTSHKALVFDFTCTEAGINDQYPLVAFNRIFRDHLIQSTLFSTHTDFIVYSERTL